jgi:hypothetical protein
MLKNNSFLAFISFIFVAGAIATIVFLWNGDSSFEKKTRSKLQSPPTQKITPEVSSSVPIPTSSEATLKQLEKPVIPSFDVVRITPDGNAVIAGRAAPNSKVVIVGNGQSLGHVYADSNGDWVFIPEEPFTPGSRQLSLRMLVDGRKTIISNEMVVLVVPEPEKDISGRKTSKPSQSLAFKFTKKDRASTVLQKPMGDVDIGTLSVDTVDYDNTGRLIISGRATPGTLVIVYLNNIVTGKSYVDENGAWRMRPDNPVKSGLFKLRADEIDSSGKVLSRISIPFSRAEPIETAISDAFVIVQPGNSLWRIARKTFGSGYEFTTIYEANKEQIKNPDLIFPGQIFSLPSDND